MKKLIISVTLMACLVLPGFLGSVYGQKNTVMPYGFLNQDLLGLNIELNNGNLSEYQNDYYFIANQDQNINCGSKNFSGHLLSSDSVLILRTQLIAHFEKGEIEEVKKIKNILWDGQKVKGENLSFPEYWLILFWTQEYDSLLALKRKASEYSIGSGVYTTIEVIRTKLKYESFYPILQEKSKKRYRFLRDQINEKTTNYHDAFFLDALLKNLKWSDPYSTHGYKIFSYNDHFTTFAFAGSFKEKSTNFGFGTGVYYQWALYGGEISNYISGHRVFFYPAINFDVYLKKFMFQVFILGYGSSTVTKVNINGDNFAGTFYGEYQSLFNIAMGYEIFSNSKISIIPNIGLQPHGYCVYPGSESGIIGHGNPLTDIIINSYSFGFMADYKILKMNKLNKSKNSYVSIRLKYDYCLTARKYEYYNGNMHQFTIGLTSTFRNSKIK